MVSKESLFNAQCRRCPRLVDFLENVREAHPDYHAGPVPAFGDDNPDLLIVGLAPGMHGANATGRPFTGDQSGVMLYQALYKTGFSSSPDSVSKDDGLVLLNCRITNAVKCLPPQNKPEASEIKHCRSFLAAELAMLKTGSVVVALGTVAHAAILRALDLKPSAYKFGHGEEHALSGGLWLIDSYHCSRYNTQTKRLTESMFQAIFDRAKIMIDQAVR